MTTKQTVIGICIALVLGIAVGRYSLPQKVITKVQTVEVEKKTDVTNTSQKDNTVIVVTQTKKADGTVVTVTETKKDIRTDKSDKLAETDSKQSTSSKEVINDSGALQISALMAIGPLSGAPAIAYGGLIQHSLLGPINMGIFGFSDGRFGVSLGLRL